MHSITVSDGTVRPQKADRRCEYALKCINCCLSVTTSVEVVSNAEEQSAQSTHFSLLKTNPDTYCRTFATATDVSKSELEMTGVEMLPLAVYEDMEAVRAFSAREVVAGVDADVVAVQTLSVTGVAVRVDADRSSVDAHSSGTVVESQFADGTGLSRSRQQRL